MARKNEGIKVSPLLVIAFAIVVLVLMFTRFDVNPETLFVGQSEPETDQITYDVNTDLECDTASDCRPYLEEYGVSSASCEEGICVIHVKVEVPR